MNLAYQCCHYYYSIQPTGEDPIHAFDSRGRCCYRANKKGGGQNRSVALWEIGWRSTHFIIIMTRRAVCARIKKPDDQDFSPSMKWISLSCLTFLLSLCNFMYARPTIPTDRHFGYCDVTSPCCSLLTLPISFKWTIPNLQPSLYHNKFTSCCRLGGADGHQSSIQPPVIIDGTWL